jgi:hypothetical protein
VIYVNRDGEEIDEGQRLRLPIEPTYGSGVIHGEPQGTARSLVSI